LGGKRPSACDREPLVISRACNVNSSPAIVDVTCLMHRYSRQGPQPLYCPAGDTSGSVCFNHDLTRACIVAAAVTLPSFIYRLFLASRSIWITRLCNGNVYRERHCAKLPDAAGTTLLVPLTLPALTVNYAFTADLRGGLRQRTPCILDQTLRWPVFRRPYRISTRLPRCGGVNPCQFLPDTTAGQRLLPY